jgi:YaaC-like protein
MTYADGLATHISVSAGRFALPPAQELRDALGLPATVAAEGGGTGDLLPSAQLTFTHSAQESLADDLPALLGTDTWPYVYVVEPFLPGGWLSTLSGLFAGSYVLSTLVRYHATRWAALANHEKGDRWLPVLEHLRDAIQTRFPALVLEELDAS